MTFISNWNIYASIQVEKGECATEPATPSREGWTFIGWYTDVEYTQKFSFKTPIMADTVLYAKWTENGGGQNPVPAYEDITLEAVDTQITLIPGEIRRLSVSSIGQYIYGIKWTLATSPKNCVTLKNGVVTAKKAGTATVTATYGDSSVLFEIEVDGKTYENTYISESGKKYRITATKTINAVIGATNKKVQSISRRA